MTGKNQPRYLHQATPLLIIISGPSGVGKDAVLSKLKELRRHCFYAVTATTRPPRAGEKNGVDYYFLPLSSFQEMMDKGELLEWAQVYSHWYGVPKKQVKEALDRGKDVIIKTDVQGAATIKRLVPQAITIFLKPPSSEELERRIRQRHSESPQQLKLRMDIAQKEMEQLPQFDYVVVNHRDKADEAAAKIEALITAEKCRPSPSVIYL